ncbi:hypothetical protein CBM2587_A160373 [Cupriavidus taiwanensis]|uniref:Uncharacterized protein n=1 Tax=Cupriavidus taiwanensis TaxID=164546 RepID=A0A975ZYX5_9BURK|nr:hypothetical protein CBM2587_A160373 [Cupriavidus taiwanensis]
MPRWPDAVKVRKQHIAKGAARMAAAPPGKPAGVAAGGLPGLNYVKFVDRTGVPAFDPVESRG